MEYTVTDSKTGKEITFEWNDTKEPTQQDMVAVFAEANRQSKPAINTVPDNRSQEINNIPWYQKAAVGMGKGLSDVNLGVMQKLLQGGEKIGIVPKASLSEIEQDIQANRDAFKPLSDQSTIANIGEFVGQVAPMLPLPGGVTGGALKRAGTAALAGGALGALQPTTADESSVNNALLGSATGGVASGTLSGAGKIYNAAKGKLPDNFMEALSKKYGIRTTLGEATGNPIIQKMETWLEGVPFIGIKGFREKQAQEATKATNEYLSKYLADPTLQFGSPEAMQANRKYASQLYENMKEVVANAQKKELNILPESTKTTAKEIETRYPKLFNKFEDEQRDQVLNKIQAGQKLSFDELWEVRSGVGDMVGQAKKKVEHGELDQTTLSQVKKLYASLNTDIEKWADSINQPQIKTAIKEANDAYKHFVVKYDTIDRATATIQRDIMQGKDFSPQKFATALTNISNKNKYTDRFSKQEIQEMTGLANIMHTARRAGQFKENPPTGNRWGLPMIVAGTAYMSGQAAAVEGGLAVATRFLTTTKTGKNLALAASKVEPNSQSMKVIMNMVYNQLPKFAAMEATKGE